MRATAGAPSTHTEPGPAGRLARVSSTGPRLVLFDIDGTLISTGGRAGAALGQALEDTFGTPVPSATYRYAGKTDPQIVFELMALVGFDRDRVAPLLDTALRRYVDALADALAPGTVRVLPGVEALLARLAARGDVRLGLLTDNVAAGAAVKLGAAGLDRYFAIGAYGSDAEDRNRLVPLARARAAGLWDDPFPGGRTVVVGDAEADISCARAGSARAVAVASGPTPRARLAALGPDALFDSLAEPGVLEELVGPGATGAVES